VLALEPSAGIGRFVQAARATASTRCAGSSSSGPSCRPDAPGAPARDPRVQRPVRAVGPRARPRVRRPPRPRAREPALRCRAACRSPRTPTAPTARRPPTPTSSGAASTCSRRTGSACSSCRRASSPGRSTGAPGAPREGAQAAPPRRVPPTGCRRRSSPARCSSPTCCSSAPAAASSPRSTRPTASSSTATTSRVPEHILGTEVGKDAGDDDQTAKPRWGYQVVGTFERLPDLVERPMCGACEIAHEVVVFPGAPRRSPGSRASSKRAPPACPSTPRPRWRSVPRRPLPRRATGADHRRARPALARAPRGAHGAWAGEARQPVGLRPAAQARRRRPHQRRALPPGVHKAGRSSTGSRRSRRGRRATPGSPTTSSRSPSGSTGPARAHVASSPTRSSSSRATTSERAQATVTRRLPELLDAGWCLDGDAWDELVPERDYLTGHLWPKHDRAVALVEARARARRAQGGAVRPSSASPPRPAS
jgi:hypothetical protein